MSIARAKAVPRTILLAWELGQGLGHAVRLLWLARQLKQCGWRPVVAAREPSALAPDYAEAGVTVLAAPFLCPRHEGPEPFRASSYADIMGACGYGDVEALNAAIDGWDALLAKLRPSAVIADHSPILSLAAYGRFPLIPIGDGFVTPPELPGGGFPGLGVGRSPVWPVEQLLENARLAQARRGRALPNSLAAIVRGIGQVVCVPPELDIHAETRAKPAAGPWEVAESPLPPPASPSFFAYLRMRHRLSRLAVEALIETGIPGAVYLRDSSPELDARLDKADIRRYVAPPAIRDALRDTTLFLHHGGIGSMIDGCLAGRTQLFFPRHLEQVENSRRALAVVPGCYRAGSGMTPDSLKRDLPTLAENRKALALAQETATSFCRRRGTAWEALQTLLADM